MELRELIARAACADCDGAEYVEQREIWRDSGKVASVRWEAYLSTADAILTALGKAGLAVVQVRSKGEDR